MGPSAPGEPFSPGGPGGPAGPGSPGRPAGPVSPRGPLPPSLPLGPGGPGRPMLPWVGVCGGGDAVRLMPQLRAPPSPSPLAEGQPGASRCQVGQGGRVEPAGPVPGIPTVPAPSYPPPSCHTSHPFGGGDTVLTEGPGGPTLPAAPGKPVAPCKGEKLESGAGPHPGTDRGVRGQGTVPWLRATTGSPRRRVLIPGDGEQLQV